MDYKKIENIISMILEHETDVFEKPQKDDWERLEKKFKCFFPEEFKLFMELMSEWSFPGDIYNVSLNNNGNDLIEDVYDWEMQSGRWNKNMIPFYGIGNGDYFCLCSKEGKKSKFYYYYEDKNLFEPYNNSFEEWIEQLHDFLG